MNADKKPPECKEGYEGERAGLSFLDCPYLTNPPHSTAHRLWVDGYVQSMIDQRTSFAHEPGANHAD